MRRDAESRAQQQLDVHVARQHELESKLTDAAARQRELESTLGDARATLADGAARQRELESKLADAASQVRVLTLRDGQRAADSERQLADLAADRQQQLERCSVCVWVFFLLTRGVWVCV